MKKAERGVLSPRERCFVELVANPLDTRSIGAKAQAVGWRDQRYGYKVVQREQIADAIERATVAYVRVLRARVVRVLSVLAEQAETGDVRAARLFLESVGVIGSGVSVSSSVTWFSPSAVVHEDTFEERLIALRRERGLDSMDG